ncbi:MAG: helix-turn-helix domain-containing protein [Myxococcales bacterium]|nr:helix-turn-helix domain-containing protein [Myxococcales bacterium]
MTQDRMAPRILHALFCLSRDTGHISATTLAAAASVTPTEAARLLVELERKGLVDASRARLTMAGLVAAARASSGSGGPRVDLEAAQRAAPSAKLPLAAGPSSPAPPSHPTHIEPDPGGGDSERPQAPEANEREQPAV